MSYNSSSHWPRRKSATETNRNPQILTGHSVEGKKWTHFSGTTILSSSCFPSRRRGGFWLHPSHKVGTERERVSRPPPLRSWNHDWLWLYFRMSVGGASMDASASSEKTATIRRRRAISCSLSEVGRLLLWETDLASLSHSHAIGWE